MWGVLEAQQGLAQGLQGGMGPLENKETGRRGFQRQEGPRNMLAWPRLPQRNPHVQAPSEERAQSGKGTPLPNLVSNLLSSIPKHSEDKRPDAAITG